MKYVSSSFKHNYEEVPGGQNYKEFSGIFNSIEDRLKDCRCGIRTQWGFDKTTMPYTWYIYFVSREDFKCIGVESVLQNTKVTKDIRLMIIRNLDIIRD